MKTVPVTIWVFEMWLWELAQDDAKPDWKLIDTLAFGEGLHDFQQISLQYVGVTASEVREHLYEQKGSNRLEDTDFRCIGMAATQGTYDWTGLVAQAPRRLGRTLTRLMSHEWRLQFTPPPPLIQDTSGKWLEAVV